MPLPAYLISISAILCEKVLHEADGVNSAIRIVDVFYVGAKPVDAPEEVFPFVQAYALVSLRAAPGHNQEHEFVFKLLNTVGELTTLGAPMRVNMLSTLGATVPGGLTASIQVNIAVKRFGTCFLCVYLDGEEVTRIPITLLPAPAPNKSEVRD
jgi:hypothetical protein